MSHFQCDVSGCDRYALLRGPYCHTCDQVYCFDHIEDAVHHPCRGDGPKPSRARRSLEDMFGPIIARLDLRSIIAQAESLRPGHKCTGPDKLVVDDRGDHNFIAHGSNLHFAIKFDDGKKWMVRARKSSKLSPPYEVKKAIVQSEAATCMELHQAGVQVPQAWLPNQWTNGGLYYFVDFVEGAYHPNMVSSSPPDALSEIIIRNLADFYISLEAAPFDAIGSLTRDEHGNVVIGPVLEMNINKPERPFHLGPFKSAKERYLTLIDHKLLSIANDAYCAPSRSVPLYLALLEAKSLVTECADMEGGPAYICHAEPKGDHILVDEQGTITGVIDWEWAYTSCKAEAFAAPWGLLDMSIYSGNNGLSVKEKILQQAYIDRGRADLAQYVEGSRKWFRLRQVLAGVVSFTNVCAMRDAFGQGSSQEQTES